LSKLRIGALIACFQTTEGQKGYWLASKRSEIKVADKNDPTTGIKKGEEVLNIIWYDCVQGLKYRQTDVHTSLSVSSVIVTVSNIVWLKTTVNRFYLGESTSTMLIDIVNSMSEL